MGWLSKSVQIQRSYDFFSRFEDTKTTNPSRTDPPKISKRWKYWPHQHSSRIRRNVDGFLLIARTFFRRRLFRHFTVGAAGRRTLSTRRLGRCRLCGRYRECRRAPTAGTDYFQCGDQFLRSLQNRNAHSKSTLNVKCHRTFTRTQPQKFETQFYPSFKSGRI